MRQIAQHFIEHFDRPHNVIVDLKKIIQVLTKHFPALLLGLTSVALYVLLYLYSKDLIHIAQDSHNGHKGLFFVPIIIALVFSLVHGSFTSYFWEMLGISAKKS